MIDSTLCLRPNDAEVAAKLMDGEAILINITSGMYHSMDGVGAVVWALIERGHALGQIVECVCRQYEVEPAHATADVHMLAETLLAEALVVPSDEPAPAVAEPDVEERLPYETPMLNTYRDMSDLLALDPPMPGLQQAPWTGDAA